MTKHGRFDWEFRKAASNLLKHRVDFRDAVEVLKDTFYETMHYEEFDEEHSDDYEDRWITLGSHPYQRALVLHIVWTPEFDEEGGLTRIITARKATRRERERYEARND